jgi:hypothetical protein
MTKCKQCGARMVAFSPRYNQCTSRLCNSVQAREQKPIDEKTAEELKFDREWQERYSGGIKL